jgi:hypothetical protein
MATDAPDLAEVRQGLIDLLEAEEWITTETAERSGRSYLQSVGKRATQAALPSHVLGLLHDGRNPLVPVPMGEPPGSRGLAYRIVERTSPNLYIKVMIESGRVVILSFKRSKHAGGS